MAACKVNDVVCYHLDGGHYDATVTACNTDGTVNLSYTAGGVGKTASNVARGTNDGQFDVKHP